MEDLKNLLLTLIQWLMFFAIPYCLYNAFGLGMLHGKPGALGTISPLDEAVSLFAMAAFYSCGSFYTDTGSSGATEAVSVYFRKLFLPGFDCRDVYLAFDNILLNNSSRVHYYTHRRSSP